MFDLPPPAESTPPPDLLGQFLPVWSPIVGSDGRPLGMRVQLRRGAHANPEPNASLAAALDAVVGGFAQDGGVGFPHGLVVLAPQDMALDASMLSWHAPRNAVLELPACVLGDDESLRFLCEVHRCGTRFALHLSPSDAIPDARRLAMFQYVVIGASRLEGGALPSALKGASILIADEGNFQRAKSSLEAKVHGLIGWALITQSTPTEHALAPMQQAVLELIQLVQSDAEVAALEAAFKRQPLLAYMLLTLANSPAFIRSTPIGSVRHAISLLGYRRLVKWLVLLLVVASKNAKALPQIYGAVARGFLMENLALANRAPSNTQDECFVVGAFSLLSAITGQSLESLLSQASLPESITAALLHQQGPLSAYLKLTLAIEDAGCGHTERISAAAQALHLDLQTVNRALLQALSATDALHSAV